MAVLLCLVVVWLPLLKILRISESLANAIVDAFTTSINPSWSVLSHCESYMRILGSYHIQKSMFANGTCWMRFVEADDLGPTRLLKE